MSPAALQQAALASLERLSGKPVVLRPDDRLPAKAKLSPCSPTEHAHVLSYHPSAVQQLPYLVCFQCRMAERAIKMALDERFCVVSNPEIHSRVEKFLRDRGTMDDTMVATSSQMIVDELGTQLRSIPIGLRVERLIRNSHPELHAMQRTTAMQQLEDAAVSGDPTMAPELIRNASTAMKAAVAAFWSWTWGEDALRIPYRLSGHERDGQYLFYKFDLVNDSPNFDRVLVKEWAKLLGLNDFYRICPAGLHADA